MVTVNDDIYQPIDLSKMYLVLVLLFIHFAQYYSFSFVPYFSKSLHIYSVGRLEIKLYLQENDSDNKDTMSFAGLNLPPPLSSSLRRMGITSPTPIQQASLLLLSEGM